MEATLLVAKVDITPRATSLGREVGRVGFVSSPVLLGTLAERFGLANVLRSTAILPLLTISLVYLLLPETKGNELEQTAAL